MNRMLASSSIIYPHFYRKCSGLGSINFHQCNKDGILIGSQYSIGHPSNYSYTYNEWLINLWLILPREALSVGSLSFVILWFLISLEMVLISGAHLVSFSKSKGVWFAHGSAPFYYLYMKTGLINIPKQVSEDKEGMFQFRVLRFGFAIGIFKFSILM